MEVASALEGLKSSKPSYVLFHWKGLAEYYQMIIHVPGIHVFLSVLSKFHIDQIRHQQQKGRWKYMH